MLAEVEIPLRELTRKEVIFHWDKLQADAFQKLKDMCCKAPVLAYHDVNKEVTIQWSTVQTWQIVPDPRLFQSHLSHMYVACI